MKTDKIKFNTKIFWMVFILVVFVLFGLGEAENARAAGSCFCSDWGESSAYAPLKNKDNVENQTECNEFCRGYDNATFKEKDKGYTVGTPNYDADYTCGVNGFMNHPLNCTLIAILKFMGFILSTAATLFNWIIQPVNMNAVIDNSTIYTTWTLIRDTLNISFIMVLLFSAFCTIFQVEKFSYRKIVLTLIIMALLVNFSFPISRFIIDAANVMMYYFINSLNFGTNPGDIFATIAENSQLADIINSPANADTSFLIAAVVFTFILAITLLIIAVLFIIRTVALAIIIIFSPIAFTGSIIPSLSKYSNQWWDNLFKYAFFGPIMIFMLYVAVQMMGMISSLGKGSMVTIAGMQSTSPSIIAALSFFAVPIVILWMGIGIAQSMSIAGAGAVVGQGKKFMGWAGRNLTGYRMGKWAGKTLAKKAERGLARGKYTWWMSPKAFKEAWKERTAELERKAFKPATGAWRDKLNSLWILGGEKTRERESALQNNIATKQKELEAYSTDSEVLMREFESARDAKDSEKLAATMRILFNNNDQNEMLKYFNMEVNPENIKKFVYDHLKNAGMEEQDVIKQLSDYGEISFAKGNFGLYGMAKFDRENKKFVLSDIGEQMEAANAKGTNVEPQQKMRSWHWNSFLTENEVMRDREGKPVMEDVLDKNKKPIIDPVTGRTKQQIKREKFGSLHNMGKFMLKNLTMLEVKQTNRARKDLINGLYHRKEAIADYAKEVGKEDKNQQRVIEDFLKEIEKYKLGEEKKEEKKEEKREEKSEQSPILDQYGKPYGK